MLDLIHADAAASPLRELLASSEQLRILFQPIVDLDALEVVGYEALARGPVGSSLEQPSELFAAARAEGYLAALDNACRAHAFRAAIRLNRLAPLTLFVNVEPEVLDGAPLADLLEIADSSPGEMRVVFEITERAIAARPAELLRTVETIRAHGWAVALDDVGADPKSLAFMSLLRPEVVKLDLRLIQQRPTPEIANVMHAVNAYTESSGALLLAEGIETEAHLDAARALGAQYGQGWLFGRPGVEPSPLPIARAELPGVAHGPSAGGSPFACLAAGTKLRIASKRLLIELSKKLEAEALAQGDTAIVAAAFQECRNFTPLTAERYTRLAEGTAFVFALGEGLSHEPVAGVRGARLEPGDPVLGEWGVVVIAPHFAAALLARDLGDTGPEMDRGFEYALTYRRDAVIDAASALLSRVLPDTGDSAAASVADRLLLRADEQ
jgi:EAL domain-containing protein (putative c-di-GMP-specific phosphodiesterase class I)